VVRNASVTHADGEHHLHQGRGQGQGQGQGEQRSVSVIGANEETVVQGHVLDLAGDR